MSMTIEEIRTSVTMALCKAATTDDDKRVMNIEEDVAKQCEVVGTHLGHKFLFVCLKDAEECLDDEGKLEALFKKFNLVGPRFSTEINDPEMEHLLDDEEENL